MRSRDHRAVNQQPFFARAFAGNRHGVVDVRNVARHHHVAFTADAEALAGGVDGTVAEGPTVMVDDTYLYLCFEANTEADGNWRRISLGAAF